MKQLPFSRTVAAGAVALALVGTSLGVAGAQQPPAASPTPNAPAQGQRPAPSGQDRHQQFLAAVASKLGISVDRLTQAMTEARTELGIPERGPGGPGGPGGRGGPHLDVAAQALGITTDQLKQELQAGRTLTQVAQARNVNPATVATALKNAANARIDQEAAAGRIPADQVAAAKQRASERIDQMMTQTPPPGRPGPNGRGGPREAAPTSGRGNAPGAQLGV